MTIAVHEPVAEAKASGIWIRGDRKGEDEITRDQPPRQVQDV